jgi:flagella basal body P-ring formation protein FlgA
MITYLLALAIVASPISDRVETSISTYVQSHFAVNQAQYQYNFKRINYALFPSDLDSVSVIRIGKSSPVGNTVFSLGCFKAENIIKTVSVSVEVSMIVDCLVANAPINVGDRFDDLIIAPRAITSDKQLPLTDMAQLIGKQAKLYIQSGTPIYPSMCENIPLVNPGNHVNIIVEHGQIKVMAQGIAKQKGGKGDTIRVANLGSNRMIMAEVIDSLTVALK